MKRVIKNSLVMAVMFTAMVGYANGFAHTNKEKDDNITNVSFKNVSEGSILTIKDVDGIVLYKETIVKQGTYSKGFDLTALPDGDYIFELDKEFDIKVIPFKVNLNKVIFNNEIESIIFKPAVILKNGFVNLKKSILSNKPLMINIYYENGELVYSEKIQNAENVVNKTYDLSSSLKGKYSIVLTSENRIFEKEIKI